MDYFYSMAPSEMVNSLILAIMFVFGCINVYRLYIRKAHKNIARLGRSINAMLFWGMIIVLIGFIGTFVGFRESEHYLNARILQPFNEEIWAQYRAKAQQSQNGSDAANADDKSVQQDSVPEPQTITYGGLPLEHEIMNYIAVVLGLVSLLLRQLVFSFTSFLIIFIVWYIFTARHRKLLERSMQKMYVKE